MVDHSRVGKVSDTGSSRRGVNTSIRDLMSDDRFTEAVLKFLARTRVGELGGKGIISRQ